ncbi:hypothetical protein ACIHCQ_27260 [Streptomyces sp. NPDC052236]|uniref:hypothetical protein n=1 Tax=Streptomyces sp. NPDC052236 TaxID=3365686 RepID=UPI0037D67F95
MSRIRAEARQVILRGDREVVARGADAGQKYRLARRRRGTVVDRAPLHDVRFPPRRPQPGASAGGCTSTSRYRAPTRRRHVGRRVTMPHNVIEDVQRLIGRKHLPQPDEHERFWGFRAAGRPG